MLLKHELHFFASKTGGQFAAEQGVTYLRNIHVVDIIKQYTELEPIIVDRNYYDVMGHIDGYLAFKDEHTVFISEYPNLPHLKQDIKYVKMLKSVAEENGLKVVPMFDRPIDEPVKCTCKGKKTRSCLYSARGVYVNYIRLNNYVIMPEYTIPQNSKMEYNWINKKLLLSCGFKVLTINCDQLAKLGGSLHCISFQY